jgi:DMSO/TMAO reductase YedYZ molybdopterin-dependent catalytic subunit
MSGSPDRDMRSSRTRRRIAAMSDTTLRSRRAPAMPARAEIRRPPLLLKAAVAGAVAALAAIGSSELVAGFLGGPSLLAAIGEFAIDHQPPGAKDVVVSLFGTNDKLALEALIVVVAAIVGAGLAIASVRRSFTIAAVGFGAFAVVGFLVAIGSPSAAPTTAMIVAVVAAVVGIQSLSVLLATAGSAPAPRSGRAPATAPVWSRRAFVLQAAGVAVASTVAGVVGRRLLDNGLSGLLGGGLSGSAAASALPAAVQTATIPAGAELSVPGLSPLVVPNDDFYRIDTALIVPSVDLASWRLRIHGMVDHEVTLAYADLAELPLIEQYVTISCVSNEVGGDLVGNAKWTGVKLREVLAMAGVQAGATQLVGKSADGWTAGMPTAWVMDPAREPMIALKMNDAPLPRAHGFPARLIVPGLYGYVSATKWLTDLELTTLEAFDGYWVPLGWAKEGPILTQSRIDVPRNGASVAAGRVPIAGVAWAPDRGIRRVEVAIDGTWQDAQLSSPISDATWVQWLVAWDAAAAGSGTHTIEVRATDGTGAVQTADRTPPAPDGARGHDTIQVSVG